MMIYTGTPKFKPKKKTKSVPIKRVKKVLSKGTLVIEQKLPVRDLPPRAKSVDTGFIPCTKPSNNVYTGSKVKGIGTMHKSNAVPIFSDEEAVDISRMRR